MRYTQNIRFNQYRNMWIMVLFDLPTETRNEKKIATEFRKKLLKNGYTMFQFSAYIRFCPSIENADMHINRVKKSLPKNGKIGIIRITDKQFKMIELYFGQKQVDNPTKSHQLSLF